MSEAVISRVAAVLRNGIADAYLLFIVGIVLSAISLVVLWTADPDSFLIGTSKLSVLPAFVAPASLGIYALWRHRRGKPIRRGWSYVILLYSVSSLAAAAVMFLQEYTLRLDNRVSQEIDYQPDAMPIYDPMSPLNSGAATDFVLVIGPGSLSHFAILSLVLALAGVHRRRDKDGARGSFISRMLFLGFAVVLLLGLANIIFLLFLAWAFRNI